MPGGRGRGRCHHDAPVEAPGEARNGIQAGAVGEGAEQAREGLVAFTDDGEVDAVDGADEFGPHLAVEVGAAEYCHEPGVMLLQAPGQRERRGVLLECRAESDNRRVRPGKRVDKCIQVCGDVDVSYVDQLFPYLFTRLAEM